jgi:hypothetical protein
MLKITERKAAGIARRVILARLTLFFNTANVFQI